MERIKPKVTRKTKYQIKYVWRLGQNSTKLQQKTLFVIIQTQNIKATGEFPADHFVEYVNIHKACYFYILSSKLQRTFIVIFFDFDKTG